MNHPEIPPNCENSFRLDPKHGHWFAMYYHGASMIDSTDPATGGGDAVLLNSPGPARQIIAAVARCAWLDAAEALVGKDCSVSKEALSKFAHALRNADAWGRWAKGDV